QRQGPQQRPVRPQAQADETLSGRQHPARSRRLVPLDPRSVAVRPVSDAFGGHQPAMMRLLVLLGVMIVAIVATVLLTRGEEPSNYRVAAIFDTARGLVPGQQAKVAGAVVGKITDVELAPGPKARVVMDVDPDV